MSNNHTTFDPRTSSVFYEFSPQTQRTASPLCFQQVGTRDGPNASSHGQIAVALTATNGLPLQQRVFPTEYFPNQEQVYNFNPDDSQCSQGQVLPQQYCPPGVVFTPQQREYFPIQRPAQFPMNAVHPVASDSDHSYSRIFNYWEDPSVVTSPQNMMFPVNQYGLQDQPMFRNTRVDQSSKIVRHVAVPLTQPDHGYPNEVQPQVRYSTPQGAISHGTQYNGDLECMQYERIENPHLYKNTMNREPTVFISVPPICEQEPFPVPVQHAQLEHFQHYISDVDYQARTEMVDGTKAIGNCLHGKQGRRKRRLVNFVEDGVGAEGVQAPRRRLGRQKKLKSNGDGMGFQPESNTGKRAAPSTHGELLKQKRRNMAFPKGTFLIRYADLDSDQYAGHIWLVDNHQLLQKYTYDGIDASNARVFSRTERYSGWLCDRPWLYHPLPGVESILGNKEKVSVADHPTRDELLARRDAESKKAVEIKSEQIEAVGETRAPDRRNSDEECKQGTPIKEEFVAELPFFTMDELNTT